MEGLEISRPKDDYGRYVKPQAAPQVVVYRLKDYFPEPWTQADVKRADQLLRNGYRVGPTAVTHNITRSDLLIISGGQDGADQAGLGAARDLGLPTGGVAPHGWLVSTGSAETLLRSYGMIEGPPARTVAAAYRIRTVLNAAQADGTIIFGSISPDRDKGSYLTLQLAKWYHDTEGKAWCHVPLNDLNSEALAETAQFIRKWLVDEDIGVLNVAGNRQFKLKGLETGIRRVMGNALEMPLKE